jgi:CreA protein
MHRPTLALLAAIAVAGPASAAEDTAQIGYVNTALTNLGLTRSHRIVVERFEDPEVRNVACYISQARTGGISGMVGIAEDPARFALACTATGPVEILPGAARGERGEVVHEQSTSFFFKETRVHRFVDEQRQVVTYLAWSTKLVEGSPFSAVAVVPVGAAPGR